MPTVLRVGPYQFYFYSHEGSEPMHVHVDKDNLSAKLWLEPVQLARNTGFNAKELRDIIEIVIDNQQLLINKWHGYFRNTGR